MPVYEYRCDKCGKIFSITMSISEHEKKKAKCPKCNSGKVVPQLGTFFPQTSKKS